MAMLDAAEVYLQLGDAFVIPKGLNYQWQQIDFVHKIFMIVDGAVPDAENASLKRISVPDLDLRQSKNSLTISRMKFFKHCEDDAYRFAALHCHGTPQFGM